MKINNALKEVLNSRMYENARGTVFNSPKEILTPLIDMLTPYVDSDNYRIKNTVGSINRNDDDSANIAYDKLIVEFELNIGGFAAEYSNMCVVFDLSGKKALYKVAAGHTIRTCLNMCISSDNDLFVSEDTVKINKRLLQYLDEVHNRDREYLVFKEHLENRELNTDKLHQSLGQIVYNTESKVLRNFVIDSLGEFKNSKSNYYIEGEKTNLWNVYNCITQQMSNKFNKGYLDYPSLTLELRNQIILN
jgi:hypothetical protein